MSVRQVLPLPLVLLGALIVGRLALSAWWIAADEGVLDVESGRHLQRAWDGYVAMGDRPFALFEPAAEYPPLLYLMGALGPLVGGLSQDSFMLAQDVFLIPALAVGAYGAASVAYGRWAGVVAAVFALGAPMAVSAFQMFLIDTTETAMVALALWGILASRRFSRTGVSALAGAVVGLGMLSKQNFPLFIVGALAVVLVRGGWRHWRGLLAFGAVALAITLTWYWSELTRSLELVQGASAPPSGTGTAGGAQPERWTPRNVAWYTWSTLNISVLLPLTLAAVAGGVVLLVRWFRTRAPGDPTPELVVGGLVAYLGLTWIALKDPRYAMPILPYMAALGGGWAAQLRPGWRRIATAAICLVALVNLTATFTEAGDTVRITLGPNASRTGLGERQATLYAPGGWIRGAPDTSGAVPDLMRAVAADATVDAIVFDPGAHQSDFNHPGLDIRAREAGLAIAIPHDPGDLRQAVLANRNPPLADPPPCAVRDDGTGLYLSRGPVADLPFAERNFFCP